MLRKSNVNLQKLLSVHKSRRHHNKSAAPNGRSTSWSSCSSWGSIQAQCFLVNPRNL